MSRGIVESSRVRSSLHGHIGVAAIALCMLRAVQLMLKLLLLRAARLRPSLLLLLLLLSLRSHLILRNILKISSILKLSCGIQRAVEVQVAGFVDRVVRNGHGEGWCLKIEIIQTDTHPLQPWVDVHDLRHRCLLGRWIPWCCSKFDISIYDGTIWALLLDGDRAKCTEGLTKAARWGLRRKMRSQDGI